MIILGRSKHPSLESPYRMSMTATLRRFWEGSRYVIFLGDGSISYPQSYARSEITVRPQTHPPVSSHSSRQSILHTLHGVGLERTNIGTASLPAILQESAPPEISTEQGVLLQLQDPPRSPATFFTERWLPDVAVLPSRAMSTPRSLAPVPSVQRLGSPHRTQNVAALPSPAMPTPRSSAPVPSVRHLGSPRRTQNVSVLPSPAMHTFPSSVPVPVPGLQLPWLPRRIQSRGPTSSYHPPTLPELEVSNVSNQSQEIPSPSNWNQEWNSNRTEISRVGVPSRRSQVPKVSQSPHDRGIPSRSPSQSP